MPAKTRKKKKAVVKRNKPAAKRKAVRKSPLRARPKKRRVGIVKPASKKRVAGTRVVAGREGNVVGVVTHYFPKVRAAVIKLKMPLSVGDAIRVKGHTTNFQETVSSIQIDHVPVASAARGEEIGLQVSSRVRRKDVVYKI